MALSSGILNSLVSVTQFNRGQAAKIFERLRVEPRLIVLKNNQPSAVILSPEEYTRLAEIEENYVLLMEANERLAKEKNHKTVSFETAMEELGVTEKEVENAEDMEIG